MRTNFFSRIFCDRTRDNGFELKLVLFRLDIRKNFFYSEGIEKLEQVSQLNCGFPSLETFKVRLDWSLSNLVTLKMSLIIAGAVGLDDL